jgi:hypothetical protein
MDPITPDELFLLVESTFWTHRHCAYVLGYNHCTLSRFVTSKIPIPDALTKARVKDLFEAEFIRIFTEFKNV